MRLKVVCVIGASVAAVFSLVGSSGVVPVPAPAAAAARPHTAGPASGQGAEISVPGYALGQPVPAKSSTSSSSSSSSSSLPARAAADANGGSLSLQLDSELESAQGTALTSALPGSGGGYIRVHGQGTIARMSGRGQVVWADTSTSLYRDWQLTWDTPNALISVPDLVMGASPADPFELAGDVPTVLDDTSPYAVGDLGDGRGADVVVAQTVGLPLTGSACLYCTFPFTVPGSNLHVGTFVSVTLAARRDIAPGEELTNDHATSTGAPDFTMVCACGTPACRTLVTGNDWRCPELRQRYGDHWVPALLALIDQTSI